MGSKKTTTNVANSTQTAAPPEWTQQGLKDVSGRVMSALDTMPTNTYKGDFVAAPNEGMLNDLLSSYRTNAGRAEGFGSQIEGAAGRLEQPISFMGGRPELNRFQGDNGGERLNAAIRASTAPVMDQLMERILPSIRSSALESGAYSGDRAMSVVPGMAINDSMDSANRIASELAYKGFQQEEDRRLQGQMGYQDQLLQMFGLDTNRGLGAAGIETDRLRMLPDMLSQAMGMYAGGSDLLSMGLDRRQGADQDIINNALARDDYGYTQGFKGLDIATDLLTRLSGNYGTSTGSSNSTTTEKTGGMGSVVQGLAGLAMGGAALAGAPGIKKLLGSAGQVSTAGKGFGSSANLFRSLPGGGG